MKVAINKIQLLLAMFIIVALLLIVFLVVPSLGEIKNTSTELVSNKTELALTDKESKAVEDFKNSYKQYQDNFKKLDVLFVDAKNPIDFIRFLETSGSASGLDVEITISPSSKKEMINNLPVITFDINTTGSFAGVLAFSETLEKGPYLVKIQNVKIEKLLADNNKSSGKLDARFLINVVSK